MISLDHLAYAVTAWIFLWGLWGVVSSRNLVHLVVSLAILQTSTYVLLLAIGWRDGGVAPVFQDPLPPGTPVVDPVVQALVLTDVVVEATVMALLLALAVRAHVAKGTLDPDALRDLRG
jgi:multicomponent Na+:H+ antiporter subunit C